MSGIQQARPRSVAAVAAALLALVSVLVAGVAPARGAARPPIQVSGTVYTFDDQIPIAGAAVRVAELPRLSAMTAPDGSYDLTVPDGTKFTPYVDAAGHHRIYLQTYVSQGKDLERVNFQVPTDGAYDLLATLLSVPRDANDELVKCAVVSTFSTVNVRDLSFPDFVSYGAHGVAGATATARPALPKPVYFNEAVIPDASRTQSSVDGGVVWPVVSAGVYRFTAHHPSTRFAPFRATCRPGRVVNANPPQGFYELRPGEKVDTSVRASLVSARFDLSRPRARLRLRVRAREYVALRGLARKGKRVVRRRTRRYAPGRRSLVLPIGRGLAGKRIAVKLTLEDGQGNLKTLARKLKVPGH
jgi:hypothetical protein